MGALTIALYPLILVFITFWFPLKIQSKNYGCRFR